MPRIEPEPVENSFTIVDSLHDREDQSPGSSLSAPIIENSTLVQNLYEGPKKCRCCVNWVDQLPAKAEPDEEEPAEEEEKTPIVIRYSVTRGEDTSRVSIHSIEIQDSATREALFPVFEGFDNIHPSINYLVFHAPFKPFFYRWEKFEAAIESCEVPRTKEILTQLRSVVRADLAEAFAVKKELVANGLISFPYLWIIFQPGELVCQDGGPGNERFYYLESTEDLTRQSEFRLFTQAVEYDGFRYGLWASDFSIYSFAGTRKITRLNVFPAQFIDDFEKVREAVIERGRKFCSLTGVHYKEYPDDASGSQAGDGKRQYRRVMIDPMGSQDARRMLHFLRLKEDMVCETTLITQVPVDIPPVGGHKSLERSRWRSTSPDRDSYRDRQYEDDPPRRVRRIQPRPRSRSETPPPRVVPLFKDADDEPLSEFHLQICTTHVPGFCLKKRRWGK